MSSTVKVGSPKIWRNDFPSGLPERKNSSLGAGPGHHLEGRVGDELGDRVADHQLLAAADLHEAEQVAVRRREVPGEGVLGLVEVVVGVEDGEVDCLGHG